MIFSELSTEELLRAVDRSSPEVKALSERLERLIAEGGQDTTEVLPNKNIDEYLRVFC